MRPSAFFFALVSLTACSSSEATAPPTGSTCAASSECGGGLCLRSADFPNGYCTKSCDLKDPSTCAVGSVCIDDASGAPADAGVRAVCYQACADGEPCQAGLSCSEKASKRVCRAGK